MIDVPTLIAKRDKVRFDANQLLAGAEKENRALTPEEEKQHQAHLKSLEDLGKQVAAEQHERDFLEKFTELAGQMGPDGQVVVSRTGGHAKSLGEQFVESAVGKWLIETKSQRPQYWQSPSVELKATLVEGALLPAQLLPAIAPGPIAPVSVAQLLARGFTEAAALAFLRETTFTNAAAPVAEGAVKPESTLIFERVDGPLRKVATWLPATDEILEDVPAMRSYIDARLRHGVAVALDNQLLNGDGVAPNLLGLLNTPGLAPSVPRGTDPAADAIAKQIAAIQTATSLQPDGIILHPTDWLNLQLTKTTAGEYLGAGPFVAPVAPTLWGLTVGVTSAIALGTALVGAFSTAAQLFLKGGIRVDVTNSHQDFFIKNLVAIRAEVRAMLAVYRPAAFGTVTGL